MPRRTTKTGELENSTRSTFPDCAFTIHGLRQALPREPGKGNSQTTFETSDERELLIATEVCQDLAVSGAVRVRMAVSSPTFALAFELQTVQGKLL
jgi:hypothetical protein